MVHQSVTPAHEMAAGEAEAVQNGSCSDLCRTADGSINGGAASDGGTRKRRWRPKLKLPLQPRKTTEAVQSSTMAESTGGLLVSQPGQERCTEL